MQTRRRVIPLLATFLLLAVVCGLLTVVAPAEAVRATSGAAGAAGSSCRFVKLSPRPGWVSSGAWVEAGTELVVADARDRKVLSFDAQGRGFMPQPEKLTRAFQGFSPVRITANSTASHLFVEFDRERFAVLDSRGAFPIYRKNLLEESVVGQASKESRSLDKLYLWAPVETDLLAYASIKEVFPNRPESWRDGFVRVPVQNPRQFRPLVARNREASRIFYRLGHPLISSLGDTGYLLLLDSGSPDLYRNRKGSEELESMNALDEFYKNGKRATPLLPSFIRPEDLPAVMRAVERSSMPVGLYGWGGSLYTLFRSPSSGGTKWVMVKIDPEADRIVSSFDIPTRANHLTVVPGPKEWAFIEKGPVRGHKDQDVNSVLFVTASRIQTATERDQLCR